MGAYKMVELDEHLGGWTTEHRECQNYESERFMSYFRRSPGYVRYLSGGFAAGFHHVSTKSGQPRCVGARLYQVKGKRSPVRLIEVYPIEWSSLNRFGPIGTGEASALVSNQIELKPKDATRSSSTCTRWCTRGVARTRAAVRRAKP